MPFEEGGVEWGGGAREITFTLFSTVKLNVLEFTYLISDLTKPVLNIFFVFFLFVKGGSLKFLQWQIQTDLKIYLITQSKGIKNFIYI